MVSYEKGKCWLFGRKSDCEYILGSLSCLILQKEYMDDNFENSNVMGLFLFTFIIYAMCNTIVESTSGPFY